MCLGRVLNFDKAANGLNLILYGIQKIGGPGSVANSMVKRQSQVDGQLELEVQGAWSQRVMRRA